MSAREPVRIREQPPALTGAALAHAIAATAASTSGFKNTAAAHAEHVRRELCACGQMFADYCPGPADGRCPLE